MASARSQGSGKHCKGCSEAEQNNQPWAESHRLVPREHPTGLRYFVSVLTAGACGSLRAGGARMGFACRTNPAALLPGTDVWGCPSAQDKGPPARTSPSTAGCTTRPLSSGAAAPVLLTSSPSLAVCPFPSTPTPLTSQPFCCAHASLLSVMYLHQHPFARANSCRLSRPDAPLRRHGTSGLSLHPHFILTSVCCGQCQAPAGSWHRCGSQKSSYGKQVFC